MESADERSAAWVEVDEEPGALILRVGAEIDLFSRDLLETAIVSAVASADKAMLDLSGVTFCDSQGLALFVEAHGRAEAAGARLIVGNVPANIGRVFEISGIDRVLHIS